MRKFLGVYAIFLGWMIILNSHYEKKIPQSLEEMGMFRKYRVLYEEKFVWVYCVDTEHFLKFYKNIKFYALTEK